MYSYFQVGIDISYLDFEFVQDLVNKADSRASEFHMFRFIYKWCKGGISFRKEYKLVNSIPETSSRMATSTNPKKSLHRSGMEILCSQVFFLFLGRENAAEAAEYMKTLLQQINFARMCTDERRKAEIDLVEMGIHGYKALSNTLYASQILHEKDIEMIKVNLFR